MVHISTFFLLSYFNFHCKKQSCQQCRLLSFTLLFLFSTDSENLFSRKFVHYFMLLEKWTLLFYYLFEK